MSRIVIQERLMKLYATFSVPRLLADNNISDDDLTPPKVDPVRFFNIKTMHGRHFTPLWYYDDVEFDSRNADEWVKYYHGYRLPVTATVYLPKEGPNGVESAGKYEWTDANVIDYHAGTKLYSVVPSDGGSTVIGAKARRIQIHFKEEDPRQFVNRIKRAISIRDYCEKSML